MFKHIQRQLNVNDNAASTLKVAFASGDHKHVDQHFGSCQAMMVYGIDPEGAELIQVTEFNVEQGHSLSKLESRMSVISDCFAVFCVAVGESVFRQLLAAGIRAINVNHGTPISQLITQFQQQWSANAEEGKRRIVRKERASSRFAELETSSWNDE